jgi:hypothetical protein
LNDGVDALGSRDFNEPVRNDVLPCGASARSFWSVQ